MIFSISGSWFSNSSMVSDETVEDITSLLGQFENFLMKSLAEICSALL